MHYDKFGFVLNLVQSCITNFYRPRRSWGKVIFSVVCVKNSVHRGEGSSPLHAGIPPPPCEQTPSGADLPPTSRPPPPGCRPTPAQCMLGDTGNKRAVRILLECNLFHFIFIQSYIKNANVANFVYCGKTRMALYVVLMWCLLLPTLYGICRNLELTAAFRIFPAAF